MTNSLHKLGLLACAGKIVLGSLYYASIDVAKESCVEPLTKKQTAKCPEGEERWSRPFFGSAVLFFGMCFTLLPFLIYRNGKPGVPRIDRKVWINMLLPSLFEFVGQILFLMGVEKIPVALGLTLKGSRVAFSALFVVILLKRKLRTYHWVAVGTVLAGLAVASVPEIVLGAKKSDPSKTTGKVILGIALALAGEFIRAFKSVLEERFMKKLHYDALMVVGLQGVIALLLSIPTLAVVDAIDRENLKATWAQFTSNPLVWSLLSLAPITVSGLFISGAYVTKLMSSVHNALTGSITTAIVWVLSIIIHLIDKSRGLEVKPIHTVQVVGFLIVVVASMVYDAMLRLPFFTYPTDRAEASGAGTTAKTDPADPDLVIDADIKETAGAIGISEDDITVQSDEEQATIEDEASKMLLSSESPTRRRRN
jgi:drug/metabolite transporter (DMT)-like permease